MYLGFNRAVFCLLYFCISGLWLGIGNVASAYAIDISDIPVETVINAAPSNLMVIIDNSYHADWEVLTPESGGGFKGFGYLFPEASYLPRPDHYDKKGHCMDNRQRLFWKSQWHGYNSVYYNPAIVYEPWPQTRKHGFTSADPCVPFSNPVNGTTRFKLFDVFFKTATANQTINIANAHYFIVDDLNHDGYYETDEPVYLVTWTFNDSNSNLTKAKRNFYRFLDNGNAVVEKNELAIVTDPSSINRIRGKCVCRNDEKDLQNFANWFSYHRRRLSVVKSAIAGSIGQTKRVNIGVFAVAGGPRTGILPLELNRENQSSELNRLQTTKNRDNKNKLMDAVYEIKPNGCRNALRSSLDQVGGYFHRKLPSEMGKSPYWNLADGGACQKSFAMIVSCGYWNGDFSGVGNADSDKGRPYADQWSDTLADIAMHYYDTDLAPELPDLVPPINCDEATHQHLTTFSLTFGQKGFLKMLDIDENGHLDKPGYPNDLCFNKGTPMPQWPKPIVNSQTTIDDIWHAAVNGRGKYFNVTDPSVLADAVATTIGITDQDCVGKHKSVCNGFSRHQDHFIQTFYQTSDWSGDVVAFSLKTTNEKELKIEKQIKWRASDHLHPSGTIYEKRRIISYGGPWQSPEGVPFRYHYLSDHQRKALGSDLVKDSVRDRQAERLLAYVRGKAFSVYRKRSSLLGDIVHSTPVVAGKTVFVGANDGMLHAFSMDSGVERFAYVPCLIFDNLKDLCLTSYEQRHRFYVDGPLTVGEVLVGKCKRVSYLIGGLGKGGKGYYCLKIRCRKREQNCDGAYRDTYNLDSFSESATETDLSRAVQWEYPGPDTADDGNDNDNDGRVDEADENDPDIGYSFSAAYVVNTNAPGDKYRPVAIFGNGYNSESGNAVLYVLDVQTGKLIRKIDTGVSLDNGLSTPALIDVNLDRCVDYAYAGDLKGNLWKFDLTAENPDNWGVAYGVDKNQDGVIDAKYGDEPAALFQAIDQPITGRPDVMKMINTCEPQAPGYMVVFGTGKYLGPSDRRQNGLQSIYGLWDYGDDDDDSEYLGYMKNRLDGALSSGLKLFPRKATDMITLDGSRSRRISDDIFRYGLLEDSSDGDGVSVNNHSKSQHQDPLEYAGWFFDFPSAENEINGYDERVTGNATIRNGKMILSSFAPKNEPCSNGDGLSWLYLLDGCSGRLTRDTGDKKVLVTRYPGRLNNYLAIFPSKKDKVHGQDIIVGSDDKGVMMMKTIVGEKCGKVFWRENIW